MLAITEVCNQLIDALGFREVFVTVSRLIRSLRARIPQLDLLCAKHCGEWRTPCLQERVGDACDSQLDGNVFMTHISIAKILEVEGILKVT